MQNVCRGVTIQLLEGDGGSEPQRSLKAESTAHDKNTHTQCISQVQGCVQTQGGWPTAAWTQELDGCETQQPTYVALRKAQRLQATHKAIY